VCSFVFLPAGGLAHFAHLACSAGIDPDRFLKALDSPIVMSHVKDLETEFRGKKVLLARCFAELVRHFF
jgi:trehalose-6-phosphate synthase